VHLQHGTPIHLTGQTVDARCVRLTDALPSHPTRSRCGDGTAGDFEGGHIKRCGLTVNDLHSRISKATAHHRAARSKTPRRGKIRKDERVRGGSHASSVHKLPQYARGCIEDSPCDASDNIILLAG
jgi:hypothetical protein